ncbi:MATE family efflux transporter [uncultured Kushneria sp.]|uniref:lipopolysaccharide biosynthesis protein n=1 Tax=uncultured Kushneria sp. TaxID=905033 RepID=UPI00261283F7|nr:MATE family efflux transporter [uncultured Kushneria sp.]
MKLIVLAKRFSWALLGRVFGAVVQALMLLLYARWSTVEEFGTTISLMTISVVAYVITDVGFSPFTIVAYAKNENKKVESIFCYEKWVLILTVVVLEIVFFTVGHLMMMLIPIWAAFEKRADLWLCLAQAEGDNKKISYEIIKRRMLSLVVYISLVGMSINNIYAFTGALLAGGVYSLWSVSKNNEVFLKSNDVSAICVLKESVFYYINSIAAQMRNLDVPLVNLFGGNVQGGMFAIVNRIISPMTMVATSVSMVIMPAITKKEIKGEKVVSLLFLTIVLSSIPIVVLYFFAPYITLVVGSKYQHAVKLIELTCLGLFFYSAANMFISVLQGMSKAKVTARVNIASSCLYIILIPMVALKFGAIGSVWLLNAYFFILFLGNGLFVFREIGKD